MRPRRERDGKHGLSCVRASGLKNGRVIQWRKDSILWLRIGHTVLLRLSATPHSTWHGAHAYLPIRLHKFLQDSQVRACKSSILLLRTITAVSYVVIQHALHFCPNTPALSADGLASALFILACDGHNRSFVAHL